MCNRPGGFKFKKRAKPLLEFIRERGEVHPREVDEHFAHGHVTNYWGGSSNASTHLLDAMHYSGMLRIVRREKGIRIYKVHQHEPAPKGVAERRARIDALADVVVRIYAPLTGSGLSNYLRRLRYAVPQWEKELPGALERAKERMSHAHVENVDWYWPANENPLESETQGQFGFWRRLIRWSTTARDLSVCGVGFIALKLTRLLRNASSVTTRCRCYGATV